MNPYRSLFLITECRGHPSPAFETTGALALASGASVHLCAFDYSEMIALVGLVDRAGMEKARAGFLTQRRASVQSLANTLAGKGIHATADGPGAVRRTRRCSSGSRNSNPTWSSRTQATRRWRSSACC